MQYIRINDDGDKYYYKDKEMTILHRENGPAMEFSSGNKCWYLNGKKHRTDGPAGEWSNRPNEWCINGKELTEEEFNNRLKPTYCQHCGNKLKEGF